ncbi:MAG: hypothetical protein R2867_17260 [Caldilineaceae bacterium]
MHLLNSAATEQVRIRAYRLPLGRIAALLLFVLLPFVHRWMDDENYRAVRAAAAEIPNAQSSCPLYPSPHLRIGVNVAKEGGVTVDDYAVAQTHAGWYHDYNQQLHPTAPNGMLYHQMLRTSLDTSRLEELVGPLVDANPGAVWVLGNEPDRYGQDEMTPAAYAVFYHDLYTFLKARDAASRVAIGAIVQATPLRLRYLDMVLDEYHARYGTRLETDFWTLHGFNLPEQCSWGAGIPPGLEAFREEGVPCLSPLSEHGNLTTFQTRIRNFRQWMVDRGYRNTPLILSEYGILLTSLHGFQHSVVRDYMLSSFDFMLNEQPIARLGFRPIATAWFSNLPGLVSTITPIILQLAKGSTAISLTTTVVKSCRGSRLRYVRQGSHFV